MRVCGVALCRSKLGLHRIPEEMELRQRWLNATGNLKYRFNRRWEYKKIYICSKHFLESDYKNPNKGTDTPRRLKKGAVPSLNLPASLNERLCKFAARQAERRRLSTDDHALDLSNMLKLKNEDNEFQENIDFAAYLKLDRHISGTLMGERVSVSNSSGKDTKSNRDKKCQDKKENSPVKNTNLGSLSTSQVMAEDSKLKWIHQCPECLDLFTSNINMRLHFKLKHFKLNGERNQIYQSGDPVSMVVEKYKMMDAAASDVNKEDKSNGEKGNILTSPAGNDKDEGETSKANNSSENQEAVKNEICSTATFTPAKKKIKPGTRSKLSSIVQRLASKINVEKSMSLEKKVVSPVRKSPDKEPVSQLEGLSNRIFTDVTSPSNFTSPKRNKRKPSSVQHVIAKDPTYETPCKIPMRESTIPGNCKQNITEQLVGSWHGKEPGIFYSEALDTGVRSHSNMPRRKTAYEVYPKPKSYGRLSSACHPEDKSREPLMRTNHHSDLSQRATPCDSSGGSPDPQIYP